MKHAPGHFILACIAVGFVGVAAMLFAISGLVLDLKPTYAPPETQTVVAVDPLPDPLPIEREWCAVLAQKGLTCSHSVGD